MIIRPVQIQTHLIYFIFIFWYVSVSHCSYFPFSLKNIKKLAGYSIRLHCNINKLCYYVIRFSYIPCKTTSHPLKRSVVESDSFSPLFSLCSLFISSFVKTVQKKGI